jgi:hypothetical protein
MEHATPDGRDPVVRVGRGRNRRATLPPKAGTDPTPEAAAARALGSEDAPRAAEHPSANDARLLGDRPPHWG